MTRCAIYARYSSDLQSPASITDQIRTCREYASRQGWIVIDAHIYTDEAVSAAGMDRPGLARMMAIALDRACPFDVILIDDTSRLSRNLSDALRIFDQLKFSGRRAVAISQGVDTASEQADVLVTVHGLVDGLYVRELAAKTRRGMEGQVLRGFSPGGRCFGYRNVKFEGEGSRFLIDEDEAAVVRRIFELSAAGTSLEGIAKRLNADCVMPPRQRSDRTHVASWCSSAVRAMLRNERYVGQVVWNRSKFVKRPGTNKRTARPRPQSEWRVVDLPELRIVSDELWKSVQERLEEAKQRYGRGGGGRTGLWNRAASSPYLFSGLLKCGECGANMIIKTGGSGRYYGCAAYATRGTCSNRLMVRRELLERKLTAGLQRELTKPGVIDYLVGALYRLLKAEAETSMAGEGATRSRRTELDGELKRLTMAVAEGGHSRALLDAIATRERELSELDVKLAKRHAMAPDPTELRSFVERKIGDVGSLLSTNLTGAAMPQARAEIACHTPEIRLKPTETNGKRHYVVEGEWNLLGSTGGNTVSVGCGGRI